MINIVAKGSDGANAPQGLDGPTPGQALPGRDADCGFWDDEEPTRGQDASSGGFAPDSTSGVSGGNGGSIVIEVTEYRGGIEADCRGGNGGSGGNGGRGGQGGKGGDGGWGDDCEANAYGGRGGDGGNGGNGGRGGNGGKGGSFQMFFKQDRSGGNAPIWNVAGGSGGLGGQGGLPGLPGETGTTGKGKSSSFSHSDYDPGNPPPSANFGQRGNPGLPGDPGTGGSGDWREVP